MWGLIRTGVSMLFGGSSNGSNNVMEAAKAIGGFIDEQDLTSEEKVKYNAALIPKYADFMQSTINENSQRSLTRRDIAIWVIRVALCILVASIPVYALEMYYVDSPACVMVNDQGRAVWIDGCQLVSQYMFSIVTTNPLSYLVLGVGAFFFGAHIVRQYKGE